MTGNSHPLTHPQPHPLAATAATEVPPAGSTGPGGRARSPKSTQRVVAAGCCIGALLLAGCADLKPRPNAGPLGLNIPYRIDIVQGNVVTREQLDAVRPGMTRQQVRQLLGSPLLTDVFHADRWDYVFTIDRPGTPPQQRSLIVTFDGDRLSRVEAPELPAEQDFVASIARPASDKPAPSLVLTPEQLQALPKAAAPPTPPAAAASAALRVYPPLEP